MLFKQFTVRVIIEKRRTERFNLSCVIAATNSKDHPAAGQHVGHRVVLGKPYRVPHRCDIEAAAKTDIFGPTGQVRRQHQDVRDALVSFPLKVMLGEPESVVAGPVHHLCNGVRFIKRLDQFFVWQ